MLTFKLGAQKIVCDSFAAFQVIRAKYFPDTNERAWVRS